MVEIKKHLDLLGFRARDRVTGFQGVISSISFDLYGCIQAIVTPGVGEKGEIQDSKWIDVCRLELLESKPVMTPPNFDYGPIAQGKKGPGEKPAHYKN